MKLCGYLLLTLGCLSVQYTTGDRSSPDETQRDMDNEIFTSLLSDLRYAVRVYSECSRSDLSTCLKMKLLTAVDRASRSFEGKVDIADNIHLIPDTSTKKPEETRDEVNEKELESKLPESTEDKEMALNELILDRILKFLKGHVLQMTVPSNEMESNSLEEGRKKTKKYAGLLILPLLLGASLIPIALGGLALLAGKALLISKIALVLAGIIGLKKLFSHDDHHDQGHYSRKINEEEEITPHDAQLLAYRSYVHRRSLGATTNPGS